MDISEVDDGDVGEQTRELEYPKTLLLYLLHLLEESQLTNHR